ncbi:DNA primase [Clostridia bacterium]|nr:DNA primase [Clostridia bacterium]
MIDDNFLKIVTNANPIETVIGEYVNLKKSGKVYMGLCPFHSEKSPSFTVYGSDRGFYCYGCGVGGNLFTFIQKAENLEFMDSVKFLAQRAGIEMPSYSGEKGVSKAKIYEINRETANFYYKTLLNGNNKNALQYLANRGISPQTVKIFGLGFAPNSWDSLYKHLRGLQNSFSDEDLLAAGVIKQGQNNVFDFFRNRIMFPIVDLRGNVIAFGGRVMDDSKPKYLNSSDSVVFNKRDNLFSLNFAKNALNKIENGEEPSKPAFGLGESTRKNVVKNTTGNSFILCEGYMDVISLYQAGFKNAIATLGTAITDSQARSMARYVKEIIVAYDSDEAGQKATAKSINILSQAGLTLKTLKLPDCKDPDEYIKKHGALKFKILLEHSGDAISFELERAKKDLDLQTPSGRAELLKRQVQILVNISNDKQRAVYSADVSSSCGVPQQIVMDSVNLTLKQKAKNAERQQWREIQNKTIYVSPDILPAEKNILSYMLKYPEQQKFIAERINVDELHSDMAKSLYVGILNQNIDLSNIMFLNIPTAEMSLLIKIANEAREIIQNEETLSDSINHLKKEKKDTEITDDFLLSLVEN